MADSHKEDTKDFDTVKRCSPLLGNKLHITLDIKMELRKCITQTRVINLVLLTEAHSPHFWAGGRYESGLPVGGSQARV